MVRFWGTCGAAMLLTSALATVPAIAASVFPGAPSRIENDPRAAYRLEHVDMDLTLLPGTREIRGQVSLALAATDLLKTVVLDLAAGLQVDSAWTRSASLEVERTGAEQVSLALPELLTEGMRDTLQLRYRGRPGERNFFSSPEPPSGLLAASTDMPGQAHSWWPCKDMTEEKLTTHLKLTAPASYTSLAAGRLLSRRENPDGSVTTEYLSDLPASPFQLAVCFASYETWSVVYHSDLSDRDLPIEFYALPWDTSLARDRWSLLAAPDSGILARLEFILGPLPGLQDPRASRAGGGGRNGEAEPLRICAYDCPARSGQGLLRLDPCLLQDPAAAKRDLVEQLTHQWYGAAMSPARPRDLWIDRAMASYATALIAERFDGWAGYLSQMEGLHRDAFPLPLVPADVTWDVDTTSVMGQIMSGKGAWMLHMLRWALRNQAALGSGRPVEPGVVTPPELADAAFLRILRALGGTQAYRWSTFTTEDFVRFWEESVPLDLHWFFAPWLFGTGRPRLAYHWTAATEGESTRVHLHLEQRQEDPLYPNGEPYLASPRFFPTLWPVRILGPGGRFTELVVHQTARDEDFTLNAGHPVDQVLIDPDHWLLRELEPFPAPRQALQLLQIKPNPSSGTIALTYRISQPGPVEVTLHDVQGRTVRRWATKEMPAGIHLLTWDGRTENALPADAGVYFARIRGAGSVETAKFVVIRR